jgi:hypothetical protein
MFNQQEVQILIGGVNSPVDVEDLRQHTVYGGLFAPGHETIQMFWKVCKPVTYHTPMLLVQPLCVGRQLP